LRSPAKYVASNKARVFGTHDRHLPAFKWARLEKRSPPFSLRAAPGGKLPLNTNGGGLSYMHSGMYGMYALQESVRQMRGTAPAQIPDAKISVCHGVGGMFAASGTIIMSNEPP
jgi:hypothetical protein